MKKSSSRSLQYESLEARQLFASDLALPHNFVMPEDCDGSGMVSPLDALVVINQLNDPSQSPESTMMLDVSADGELSPLDALVVINHLNSKSPDGTPILSGVAPEARIARLEKAISALTLPATMTLADAEEVLDTLKLGGRPELGERVIGGKLLPKTEVTKIENERAAKDLTLPLSDDDEVPKLQSIINRFATRLKAAGVDAEVITTITGEIIAGVEANKPLTLEQIKTRLTELGVDLTKLFPAHTEPESPVNDRIRQLVTQLNKAGVTAAVVTTIVSEIQSSVVAGTPLTIDQIRARLVDLGVDVSKLFPTVPQPATNSGEHGGPKLPVQLVVNILQRAKVSADTIEIVRNAMNDANSLGTPLTISQLLKLLSDNGVRIPEAIRRFVLR